MITEEWESFPEWMDALDTLPLAVDIAAMIPHSAVRPYILGVERCNLSDRKGGPVDNPVTVEEKQAIADCVKEAIAAGAVGFSTSRFTGHRDSTGQLAPGSLADADEMIMIAKGMAEAGGAMMEMINDFSSYDDIPIPKLDEKLRKEHFEREQDWIRYVAKEYGIPVNWTDVPTAPGGKGGDNSFMDGCYADGLPVVRQMIIRPQSLIFSFRSRMHPFIATATFKQIRNQPAHTLGETLSQQGIREQILGEYYDLLGGEGLAARITRQSWGPESPRWTRLYPIIAGFDYEPAPELSVAGICNDNGSSILEFVYDHMLTNDATGTIWEGGYSDVSRFYNHAHKQLQSPMVIPGISDAGAHLNMFQDGTSPTTMLSFWTRDRVRGPKLSIEYAVMKQARDTAYLYGMYDRGTLEVGKKADINIVNMDTLAIEEPVHVHDLPTGAPRWDQKVTGYEYTILNGAVTFENGVHTGAVPGGLVRNGGVPGVKTGALPGAPEWSTNAARVATWGEMGAGSSAETALQASLDSESGISNQSRIAEALEKEEKEKSQAAKL